jgi:hypothetical protein
MDNARIDEKISIGTCIEALDLSDRERGRALAAHAKADALVSTIFAALRLLDRSPRRAVTRPNLKSHWYV